MIKIIKIEIAYDYSVSSLKDYIEIIESLEVDPVTESVSPIIYRGESENFYEENNNIPTFNASAFREEPTEGYKTGIKLPFQKNIDAFRYEVWNEIGNDTRGHFLAYSQHHGIKTNLLDFSQNPLVGLYFAVSNQKDDTGYVYIFESPVLDITPFFQKSDETNILDIICSNEDEVVDHLIRYFWGIGSESNELLERYFYLICQDFHRLVNDDETLTITKGKDEAFLVDMLHHIAINDPNKRIMDHFDNYRTNEQKGLYYFIVLRGFIRLKKHRISPISKELSGIVPMIYKPIMNFKRGINQNGLFLYQNYIISKGNALLATQKIEPTKTIKVTNKRNILKSLDRLGINSKFIYGDHSSIAKYIEDRHQEIRRIQESN
ncbi:FRG domain-containing protein [Lederbergia sp. NSJ-179]|uniref:FRG domain-containing protein n=1 Tax=Lederbergia sp. NSJ-179 TaxID=2931402 RepID=UPI001FD040E7|nr:FRG domain-containing protein [Lederbergia sp. NSJ-179]MCJ7843394.1 FRG domain-containing protein [Lederbergia sp. NSJ-179]